MSRPTYQQGAMDHTLGQAILWSAAFALALSITGVAFGQGAGDTDYKDPNVQKSFPAQPGSEEAAAAAAVPAPAEPAVVDPNAKPAVIGDAAQRGKIGFGTFGVISAVTTDSVMLQGPVPGIPIVRVPLRSDTPVFVLKTVKLVELREPAVAIVRGNLPPDAITMSPAFITFESSPGTVTGPPPVSGPGHFAGTVTVKDGKAYLLSNQKEILLVTADNTPVYRSSKATRADLRKGANLFVSRKYNPDSTWGDYEAAYILPEGPLPAIQFDAMNASNPPAAVPAQAERAPGSNGGG